MISSLINEVTDPLFEGSSWYPFRGQADSDLGIMTVTGDGTRSYFGVNRPVGNTAIENKIDQYDKIYYSAMLLSESEQITEIDIFFQNLEGTFYEKYTRITTHY